MSAIDLLGVGKKYKIFFEKSSFATSFFAWTKGKKIYEDLWALREINISILKGETVGVIGRNGSGKTTLLKILAGVTKPDIGKVNICGAVSALLELGTGFQEELTGRENIYLNGAMLGMNKKQLLSKFDSIIDFAEIGDFIDSPMRTYSTGMWMRLGFALAINADFEVLLIDEILSVGDAYFQKKCFDKFNELKNKGITILFVSHNLAKIKEVCNRVIWLDKGHMKIYDSTDKVIAAYLGDLDKKDVVLDSDVISEGVLKKRWGSRDVEIKDVFLQDVNGLRKNRFHTGETCEVVIEYYSKKDIQRPVFGIGIYAKNGMHISGPNTKAYGYEIDKIKGAGKIKFIISKMMFLEGKYSLTSSIYDYSICHPYDHHENILEFEIIENKQEERYGVIKPEGRWQHVPDNR